MRVVLSRKGVDSSSGGIASIVIDNDMIMIPIPSQCDSVTYNQLKTSSGKNLFEVMKSNIKKMDKEKINSDSLCHTDPNISNYFSENKFTGSVGQVGASQTHLENKGITIGDIFIFFGRFNNKDKSAKRDSHIIFGYLQIGEIIKTQELTIKQCEEYAKKYPWIKNQPHWNLEKYKETKNNTIYVASDKCSFDNSLKGWGTFKYSEELELTKKGAALPSQWALPKELKGLDITYHSNKNIKADYFQSAGRGQEFIIEESLRAEKWAIDLIRKYAAR